MQQALTEFDQWLLQAQAHPGIAEPTAMALATATTNGVPSCRIVLLKQHDKRGFVFYSHISSQKGQELENNPQAALCFFWQPMDRQIRIEGAVSRVLDTEADIYFASRPHGSRLGAWASKQSQPLGSRAELAEQMAALELQYAGKDVPRPPYWTGWRVAPQRIEFWEAGEARLHNRWEYVSGEDGRVDKRLLYP